MSAAIAAPISEGFAARNLSDRRGVPIKPQVLWGMRWNDAKKAEERDRVKHNI